MVNGVFTVARRDTDTTRFTKPYTRVLLEYNGVTFKTPKLSYNIAEQLIERWKNTLNIAADHYFNNRRAFKGEMDYSARDHWIIKRMI